MYFRISGPINLPNLCLVPLPLKTTLTKPPIEAWLVHSLIIRGGENKLLFLPDDRGRPMTSCFRKPQTHFHSFGTRVSPHINVTRVELFEYQKQAITKIMPLFRCLLVIFNGSYFMSGVF